MINELWGNLQALENYVSTAWSHRREPYWLIALTLLSAIRSREELAYWNTMTEGILYTPAVRDPSWQLLGYDVADSYLISGLTNFEYGKDEVQDIGEKYIPSLNEYHLFQSVEPAAEFLPLADERGGVHAPFFVFGIWLIKKKED